jgi:LacI family transcriptional regulator
MDKNLFITGKQKRVTIKDVAQAAGVSTQTVSRVMNKFTYVSGETRQRVEAVVEQLGYYPSTLARSLIQQRSYTLGIVTFDLNYTGPSRTLNGIADKADELGYMLLMKELDNFNATRIDDVIDSLLARQVDGILWAVPEIGDNHAWVDERLEKIPVPVLFIAMKPRNGIASVATDNFQGGVMATQHLLDCERKKIGHISGPKGWWEADERKRGWRETLNATGYETTEHLCVEGNWSSISGIQTFHQLLELNPDMDAIFVANDQMALSVLREASRLGIKIPEQLAVVGFDGVPETAYFYPSLTTVCQNFKLLGEQAFQNAVEMVQARHENQPVIAHSKFIQPTLIVRESSKQV